MQHSVSDYLYHKASLQKRPLFGALELSPVCNFACKMCYVRKTPSQIKREGKCIKDWTQWLELAKQLQEAGTLYLLLTGGEPFIYPNFKELYMELHKMAFVISINSNGTMINEETVEWLKKAAPSRVNITLYGASRETYERICQNPDGYDKAVKAILLLKEAGIPVVINASMIPENEEDMEAIIAFGKKHGLNTRVSTYMFPPVRREKEETDSRFTPQKAADMYMKRCEWQLTKEGLKAALEDRLKPVTDMKNQGEADDSDDTWGAHKDEYMQCRAGRSSFWISWDGTMTACGLTTFPMQVYPFEEGFKDSWMNLTDKVRNTSVMKGCAGCEKKNVCKPCVAMIQSETGDVDAKAPYLCELADTLGDMMKKRLQELKDEAIEGGEYEEH